jgi:hypothetical protein
MVSDDHIENLFVDAEISFSEYHEKLIKCVIFGDKLEKRFIKHRTFEFSTVKKMNDELKDILDTLEFSLKSGTLQKEPLGLLVSSTPGVGKSLTFTYIMKAYGVAMNIKDLSPYIYYRNTEDQYYTGMTNRTKIVVLDDVANKQTSSKLVDYSMRDILTMISPVRFYPNYADLSDKGKHSPELDLVLASSNNLHLNSSDFNAPGAVRRRFPYVILLKVKHEVCQIDGQGEPVNTIDRDKLAIMQAKCYPKEYFPSLYTLTHVTLTSRNAVVEYTPILQDVEMSVLFPKLISLIKEHNIAQIKYVGLSNKVMNSNACEHGLLPHICDDCNKTADIMDMIDDIKCDMISHNEEESFVSNSNPVMDKMFSSIKYLKSKSILYYEKTGNYFWKYFKNPEDDECARVIHTNNEIIVYNDRNINYTGVFMTSAIILSLSLIIKGIYSWKKSEKMLDATPQGSIMGKPVVMEGKSDPYPKFPIVYSKMPKAMIYKSVTLKDLIQLVSEQIYSVEANNIQLTMLEIYPHKYLTVKHLLYPWYVMDNQRLEMQVNSVANKEDGLKPNLTVYISKNQVVIDEIDDYAMIYIPDLPPGRDLIKFFADESALRGFAETYLLRKHDANCDILCDVTQSHTILPMEERSVEYKSRDFSFKATKVYSSSIKTYEGDCGSPVICDMMKSSFILGIHVAWSNTLSNSLFMRIDKAKLYDMSKQLDDIFIGMPTAQGCEIPIEESLLKIHPKSYLYRVQNGSCKVFGTMPKMQAPKCKSVTHLSRWHNDIFKHYKTVNEWEPPVMNKGFIDGVWYDPYYESFLPSVQPVNGMDTNHIKQITDHLIDKWEKAIPFEIRQKIIHPYDIHTAINGAVGVDFVDRLNMQSSAGYPWNQPKLHLFNEMEDPPDDQPHALVMNEELKLVYEEKLEQYKLGKRNYPIFTSCLKDEAMKKSKRGTTRVFNCAPVWFSIIIRQFFLPLVRLIQMNPNIFECAVGTSTISNDWTILIQWMEALEPNNKGYDDGDHKKFDKYISAKMFYFACSLLIRLAIPFYDEEAIIIMKAACVDAAFSMNLSRCELTMMYGTNPSGWALTVIINCFVNAMYTRKAYIDTGFELCKFEQHVRLQTYGDDIIYKIIQSIIKVFNTKSISEALAKYGLIFTDAAKTGEFKTNKHIHEIEFLKRKFIYNEHYKRFMAPLDEKSIIKMLSICTASSSITHSQQLYEIVQSANLENFAYGPEYFRIKRDFYITLLRKYGFVDAMNTQPLLGYKEIEVSIYKLEV